MILTKFCAEEVEEISGGICEEIEGLDCKVSSTATPFLSAAMQLL